MAFARGKRIASAILIPLRNSVYDMLPIIVVIAVFQLLVFRQPLANFGQMAGGLCLVVAGLSLFIAGLQMALFPIGEGMANAFARKGSVPWLLAFAFSLGFGTAFAEPALIAVGDKAANLKYVDGQPAELEELRSSFAFALRATVAVSVGLALVVGVMRIIKGWPIHYMILLGYLAILVITPFAPSSIVAIAYDVGGVTTSTITVPLTAALGVGLASSIEGRNPLLDGFGLIAFAALTPIMFVLGLGIIW